jgi:hypothetical protein
MNDKAIGIDWESECKSLTVKLDSMKCEIADIKDMYEAKLKNAEQTINIIQGHMRESEAKITELSVYKRFYDDVIARR